MTGIDKGWLVIDLVVIAMAITALVLLWHMARTPPPVITVSVDETEIVKE